MTLKDKLRRINWIASTQFGISPLTTLRALKELPNYVSDYIKYRTEYSGRMEIVPCLHDKRGEGGSIRNEYFWQDLEVARKIFTAKPVKHVDIGSRVDGFVAHVASYREIEVFDIRPTIVDIPGVKFLCADLMQANDAFVDYSDSISCLHSLEHFGLGRYGDRVNYHGAEIGFGNIARMLKSGGTLYLSVPIGPRVIEFNAHRVFSPSDIVQLGTTNNLSLSSLTVFVNGKCGLEASLSELPAERALGLFTFKRNSDHQ